MELANHDQSTMNSLFQLLKPAPSVLSPRLGSFTAPGRNAIRTPHYVASSSRGVIPHLSQDVIQNHTAIDGVYIGLEDFIEHAPRQVPAFYKIPTESHESALRKFVSLRDDILLIMGARRPSPIACPNNNTNNSIAISCSVGFQMLEAKYYVEAIRKLKPDVVVGLADLVIDQKPGSKRREKMVDRTHAYTRDAITELYETNDDVPPSLYFAPVLPLENTQQSLYFDELENELKEHVSGLALYDSTSLSMIPESLGSLPRLSFSEPWTPQALLRDILLGADLLTIPFISISSEGGIALDFEFPPRADTELSSTPRPLGIDLWSPSHATDISPMVQGCGCYACTKHHRAYLRHLLSAKEMLAWTLLQIHNYHVMDIFFDGVRKSIAEGTFEEHARTFERVYEAALPEQTGLGPRLRGYQVRRGERDQVRLNERVYGRLDDALQKNAEAESGVATPDVSTDELQQIGFAEKQV